MPPKTCFCSRTFFDNAGLNLLPWKSLVSAFIPNKDNLQGCFRCWGFFFSLRFGTTYQLASPSMLIRFLGKAILNEFSCRFYKADNIFSLYIYIFIERLYSLMYIIDLTFYLVLVYVRLSKSILVDLRILFFHFLETQPLLACSNMIVLPVPRGSNSPWDKSADKTQD